MTKITPNIPQSQIENIHLDPYLFKNEEWLTTDQAIAHLNISRSTLYRLRKQHRVPSLKLGGSPIFPKHYLNKVLLLRAERNLKLE
ncbi:helix-turn-helix domain-containing protein [uncultured Formosa sp.]|uniref:helix-turn-helix domain-containing protein n=1 Tax=uncultured Formosa sp. TaxID=255435 RepID=UPI00260CD025|nr:helix-turn-helix domain-containing protein [uncultured Formosa sp.]